jgi:hypothetical protein
LTRGKRWELVADADGVHTPPASIRWDRVASISIQRTRAANQHTLTIDALQPEDVERPRSTVIALTDLINTAVQQPSMQITQRMVDVPLEDLLAELETRREAALRRSV